MLNTRSIIVHSTPLAKSIDIRGSIESGVVSRYYTKIFTDKDVLPLPDNLIITSLCTSKRPTK